VPRSRPTIALLAAILLAAFVAVPGGPVRVDAAFAAAPGGRLIVVWKGDAAPAPGGNGVARSEVSRWNRHRSVVTAQPGRAAEVAARLLSDPRVAAVVPDAPLHAAAFPDTAPNDTHYAGYQQDLVLMGLPGAWPITRGSGVTVAVLDSGLDITHPDIAGMAITAPFNFVFGSPGWHTADVTDGEGHGTHVTGTIAARTDNALGIAGIAPDVTIMPLKVLDDTGAGNFSDLADAVDYAVAHGADIINLSLGGPLDEPTAAFVTDVMDAAHTAGVLVVAAAGNSSSTTPFYPAAVPSVISVSATDNAADPSVRDLKAVYSNYGPTVDVAAPGTWIASTVPMALGTGGYRQDSGTSMASPHVTAVAALVASAHPAWTPAEIEAALEHGAVDLGTAGRDDSFGWGRIDASAAVAYVPAPTPAPDVTPPDVLSVSPAAGAAGVSEGVSPVLVFSEPVAGVSGGTVGIVVASSGAPLPATVTYNAGAGTVTLDPVSGLASRTQYRIQVSAGIADAAGNPLAPRSYTFTTGDTIAPSVRSVSPASNARRVWRGANTRVTFSEAVTGVSRTTVRLVNTRNGRTVTVVLTYDRILHRVTLNPKYSLWSRTRYRVRILSGIRDLAGYALPARSFYFTTR